MNLLEIGITILIVWSTVEASRHVAEKLLDVIIALSSVAVASTIIYLLVFLEIV